MFNKLKMYGRRKEESDRGSYPLHHHSIGSLARHICATIMWLALMVWDL